MSETRVSDLFKEEDIRDMRQFCLRLRRESDPVSAFLMSRFSEAARHAVQQNQTFGIQLRGLAVTLIHELNKILSGGLIYDPARFQGVRLRDCTEALLGQVAHGESLPRLNRLLLEDAFPQELSRKRIEFVVALSSEGLSPSQIASRLQISTHDVADSLFQAVSEGRIRRSAIIHTLDPDLTAHLDLFHRGGHTDLPAWLFQAHLYEQFKREMDLEEIRLWQAYRRNRVELGDMYEMLAELERALHEKIKSVLVKEYGSGERGWWHKGVPQSVRIDCVKTREEDEEFAGDEPYCFTTLTHLPVILEKQWPLFKDRLPLEAAKDKKKLIHDLKRMGRIRNRVMHPIRGEPLTEEDFDFVRDMHAMLQLSRWRKER